VLVVPPPDLVEPLVAAIVGAVAVDDGTLTALQRETLRALVHRVFRSHVDPGSIAPSSPDEAARAIADPSLRLEAVQLMVTLEMLCHPLPRGLARNVEHYAKAFQVDEPMVEAARGLAHHHIALMYADVQRNSWYTEDAKRRILHGALYELTRSRIAYFGLAPDETIARKWRALRDCPPGSWGRGVADFYESHGFPFPGERHGISEIGAQHDFVHVLSSYEATPEGEIDVFAFIAAAMPDPRGFTLLVMTLLLFQNAGIRHVAAKKVAIARSDTLSEPGAVGRFAQAIRRGIACTVDPLGGLDHFALADEPLDGLRERFGIPTLAAGAS
jgi:hypothetical protein